MHESNERREGIVVSQNSVCVLCSVHVCSSIQASRCVFRDCVTQGILCLSFQFPTNEEKLLTQHGQHKTWNMRGGGKKQQRGQSFNNSFIFNKSNYPHIWDESGRENLPKSFTAVQHRSTECVRVCIIHCNVAVTTKAATLVLECKRKPTRQSLSLESCQRLRHLPINWTPAVFFAAGAYFLTAILFFTHGPSAKWCLCVAARTSLRH